MGRHIMQANGGARLHVLLISDYFPPEIAAPAHLLFDLATQLTARGHRVSVVTGFPRYNVTERPSRYRRRLQVREAMDGIAVYRVWRPIIDRSRLLVRGIDHLLSPLLAGMAALRVPRPDVVLVLSPPLPLALAGYAVKVLHGPRLVLNVQDLFPQNAIDLGILKNKVLIGLFRWLERWAYRVSDAITVHSPGNALHVERLGAGGRVVVIPNWVDTTKLAPLPRHNAFSATHGLDDRFVVSFAGTMGFSQDMDVILGAAERLRDDPDILFLLVGDGVQKGRVAEEVKRRQLSNVKLLPTQDRETYQWVLASSDASLATLKPDVKTPVVPSKILSVMAAGRPIIGCMPLHGDAPALIRDARAGMALPPGDAQALADAIRRLHADRSLCAEMGRNGREYVERHLSLHVATERYLSLFYQLLGTQPEEASASKDGERNTRLSV